MQFQSYSMGIPGFCTRDFYSDGSGNKWPLYEVDKAFNGSHYNNHLLPPPLPDRGNRHNSNAVKQKILEHEAVFRNQVAELHRLYRKQRELMDEVRAKELYQHHRQLNVPEFNENSFSLINLPTSVQKIPNVSNVQWLNPVPDGTVCCPRTSQSQNLSSIPWLNPVPDQTVCFSQTSQSENNSSVQWFNPAPDRTVCCPQTSQSRLMMITEKGLHTGLTGSSLKSSEIMDSKCKKYQKKILDLELPASEYMDSDDGEMVEVETIPDVSNQNTVGISRVVPEDDVNSNDSHGWLKSGQQENAQSQNPSQTRTACLVDLNEPIQLEEAFSISEELTGSFTSNEKIVPQKSSGEVCTVLQQNTRVASFELLTPPISDQDDERSENKVSRSPETSERSNDPSGDSIPNGECKLPFSNQAVPFSKVDSSELFLVQPYAMPVYELKRNPIAIQALPCFNGPVKIRRRSFISSTRSSVSLGDITWLNKRPRCSLNLTRARSTPSTPCYSSQGGKSIDLNASINWDASPPFPSTPKTSETAAEMVLESPVSPENKEGSPPRGESDEGRLEMPLHMSLIGEDEDSLDEAVRLAAKSLVSISSSEIQSCTNSDFESCDASSQNSLLWFAGVISLMPHSLEGDIQSNLGEMNEEEISAVGFDYFEVMTLRLEETKVERPISSESTQDAEEPNSPPSAKTQGRRTRPRTGRKWKDFQRDVLPCLASLSRHEVTEDLQLIETLMMEAAGVTSVLGSGRRRNGCSRARRRSCVSRSDVAENLTSPVSSPVSKQQQGPGEVSTGDRITVDWGQIRRRRRAPRHAANDFSLLSIQA